MKLIDRLEPRKRGPFAGSIGYIDYDGAMDWSIVIRTLIKTGPLLTFHVGGAIVTDSDPADEYQETLDKANGLIAAIELVERAEKIEQDAKGQA
jgi:anthranilate/para-aminobenzoate synthase component I